MMLYAENLKDATKKLLGLINTGKLQDTRLIYKHQLYLYILTTNYEGGKLIGNTIN